MGLDLFLFARYDVNIDSHTSPTAEQEACQPIMDKLGLDNQYMRTVEVFVLLRMWQRLYQVHYWIVDNIQNGMNDAKYYTMNRDQLQQLVNLCREVLANREKAEELLPLPDTEDLYDESYFDDLQTIADDITGFLNDPKFKDWEFVYSSSW